jgi:hypothetical protein
MDEFSISSFSECPEYVYDRYGRAPIGVNQQQGGDNYPFVAASEDLQQLVADMLLSYAEPDIPFQRPFRVTSLVGFGCLPAFTPDPAVHTQDVRIVDAQNRTVFDTRDATSLTVTPWGDRFLIYRWTASRILLAMVVYTTWTRDDVPRQFSYYLEPAAAEGTLDERVSLATPPQVQILVPDMQGVLDVVPESLRLKSGYNVVLVSQEDVSGPRPVTTITIDVEPGAGRGRAPADCAELSSSAIRRINGVEANAGNFQLDAKDCLRLARPLSELSIGEDGLRELLSTAGALQLSGDCEACCKCDDYIRLYEADRRLRNRLAEVVLRAHAVRDAYVQNLTSFLRSKKCREARRLRVVAEPNCGMNGDFAAAYCNNSGECKTHVVLLLSFSVGAGFSGYPVQQPYTTHRAGNTSFPGAQSTPSRTLYELNGSWPYYWAYFEQIRPGASGTVWWRLQFPDGADNTQLTVAVDAYGLPAAPALDDLNPVPGYVWGSGPGPDALPFRLVDRPKTTTITLDRC